MPPPNKFVVVQELNRQNPGLFREGHPFTTLVASRLARKDSKWGRYRNINGNLSPDKLGYNEPGGVERVDIIRDFNGDNPAIHWLPRGRGDGQWVLVEPENGTGDGNGGNGNGNDDKWSGLISLELIEGHLAAIRKHIGA